MLTQAQPEAEIVYEVRDAAGRYVVDHVRKEKPDGGKDVFWRQRNGTWGLDGIPTADLPLYGSEYVADWNPDNLIVVVEGEKAAQALLDAGLNALGTVTGASGTPGAAALEVLRDRRVCLWPDNDDQGRAHMERIAQRLHSIAAEVLIYTWDDAPEKGDAADHPATQSLDEKARERLWTDLEGAPRWKPTDREPVGTLLSEVKPERVAWLWERRIPKGKLTIIDGDPGYGKSALTTDAAARVTMGRPWPDGAPCETGGVVLMNAEDGLADTIRPRIEAAGADPSRVLALAMVPDKNGEERFLSIPEDISVVERGIERVGAVLVVVDPLMAFLSGRVNANNDQEVRRALAPLAAMAERTGAAVVVIRHMNKATGANTLYRGGGSIGIIGAARSGLVVAPHPEDDSQRVLALLKYNLSEPAPSLVFSIVTAENGAARVEWKGETSVGADQLLCAPVDEEERSALDEAVEFLVDELSTHPVTAKKVQKDARDAGIAERTLYRAKRKRGVRSERESDGSWTWVLTRNDEAEEDSQSDDQGDLGDLGNLEGETLIDVNEGRLDGQDGQDGQDDQHSLDGSHSEGEGSRPGGERGPADAPPEGASRSPQRPGDEAADGGNSAREATSEVEAALRTWAADEPDILTDDPVSIATMLSYSGRLDYEPDVNEVAVALKRVVDGGVIKAETIAAQGSGVASAQHFPTVPMSFCLPPASWNDRGIQYGQYRRGAPQKFSLGSPASLGLISGPWSLSPTSQGQLLRHGKRGEDGPKTQRWLQQTGCGVFGLPTRDTRGPSVNFATQRG